MDESKPDKSDPKLALNKLILNEIMFQRRMFRRLLDPRRDVDRECGYPDKMDPEDYWVLYDKDPLACKAVEIYPNYAWQSPPQIYEKEKGKITSPFEKDLDLVCCSISGTKSYYKGKQYNPLWDYCKRLQILGRIAQYSVMLLGFNDTDDLTKPLPGYDDGGSKDRTLVGNKDEIRKENGKKKIELKYIRVFPQHLSPIASYVNDKKSPRNGMPKTYNLTINDPTDATPGGAGQGATIINVHWSRVIHYAEIKRANEIFAKPLLKSILAPILDARKCQGAGGEGFWRGAFPGISLETNPQLGGDVSVNKDEMKNMMEDYFNSQDRSLTLRGMVAKTLAPNVADPTPMTVLSIEKICIYLSCPVRVFKGSERGELASITDDESWNDQLKEYNAQSTIPKVICPIVDRLIGCGAVTAPDEETGYQVFWPDMASQSEGQKLDNANKFATALAAYKQAGGEDIIPPHDFLVRVMKWTDEEAEAVLSEAANLLEEKELEAPHGRDELGNPLPDPADLPPPVIAPPKAGAGFPPKAAGKAPAGAKKPPTFPPTKPKKPPVVKP